jgi:pimeloyl-ACP methyl ester carboxylesterase
MPRKEPTSRPAPPPTALEQAISDLRQPSAPRQTVSARWLLSAAAISILAAAACAWFALCFLFAQGSWQLLYHPNASIIRTPASASLNFQTILFAPNTSGVPQLTGWWIPAASDAPYSRLTVLYLHSQDGNLSNSVDDLTFLHAIGLNVFAFDYRGYGQSQPAHPSEARWLEDTNSALNYLAQTRHLPPNSILIAGKSLGANLALEFAAAHPDLAGIILDQPLASPMSTVFNDPRAKLVPAHLLTRDRYDSVAAASNLLIPTIWFNAPHEAVQTNTVAATSQTAPRAAPLPMTYSRIPARKTIVSPESLIGSANSPTIAAQRSAALTRWLNDLSANPARP